VIRSSASPSAAVAPSASPSSSPAKKVKKSPPGVGLIFALILIGAAYWITNMARNRRRRRPPDPD
jgi:hypothetical protein